MPNKIISNIFQIEGLENVTTSYRKFLIRGLSVDSRDFQKNKQILINKLSRKLKHPITVAQESGQLFLITQNQQKTIEKVPKEYNLVRHCVYLNDTNENIDVDFFSLKEMDRQICNRFLQFNLQGYLYNQNSLWQPSTGQPFFLKKPVIIDNIAIYQGFKARIIDLYNKGWGLCIDTTCKYISNKAIPTRITKTNFDKYYKNKIFIYKYDKIWYQIKPTELSPLSAKEYKYKRDDTVVSLFEELKHLNITEDTSILVYYDNSMQPRGVPASLCYQVYDTDDISGGLHQHSILSPNNKFGEIKSIIFHYFKGFKYGKQKLTVSKQPLSFETKKMYFPSFELGNSREVSFETESIKCPKKLTKARMQYLTDGKTGFYLQGELALDENYIFLPKSLNKTVCRTFVQNLKEQVCTMYLGDEYKPTIRCYDDKQIPLHQTTKFGYFVVEKIKKEIKDNTPCCVLLMLPKFPKAKRNHDVVAALIIKELNNLKINVSIIHNKIVQECLQMNHKNKKTVIRYGTKGKYNGYLKNVAISKVLLSNNKYPFILKEPLKADLTIGIDVKNNVAGFIFVDKQCKNIRTIFQESKEREKLSIRLVEKVFYDTIKEECKYVDNDISTIVIHRDGRFFDTEELGIKKAIKRLTEENVLNKTASVNVIQILKSSFIPVRFFTKSFDKSRNKTVFGNPTIGTYVIMNPQTAFICTTGKEFRHKGTSNPLNISFVFGEMEFENILDDLFKLSTLAYTKPDDCSRLPITIKLLDMKLKAIASTYDKENIKYVKEGVKQLLSEF